MKERQKFLAITAFFLTCGVIMGFNMNPEAVKPEEVVVMSIDPIIVDTAPKEQDSVPFREEVYQYLLDEKGLTRNHSLGLIANGDRESRWNMAVWNPSRTSCGIFQWTGARRVKFIEAVPDWEINWKAQIDYALEEDRGPKWSAMRFSSSHTAADWFMRYWERPADKARCQKINTRFLGSYTF
jgi:hypothetical protein